MHRSQGRRGIALWVAALAVYAFLYLPLAIVVVYSFNDSRLNAEWVGFTWHWYQVLLHDEDMLIAAGNSLFIALVSSVAATVLGTMAGIAIHRYDFRLLNFMVLTPVAMPEILLGVSLLLFFIQVLNLTLGMLSIVLAHITFSIGFVAIVVRVALAALDESIFEAARDLGASPWQTFRYVTFPADSARRDRGRADGVHAVDRRFRDHVLHRRRGRADAAAAHLLDDQDRGDA